MKKFSAIIMMFCLLASVLCTTAFAALLETLDAVPVSAVLRVSALKRGETNPVVIGEYTSFEDGWNAAMKIAGDDDTMDDNGYERIVVDLHSNWDTKEYGVVTIPEEARVTINLNGHIIDRKKDVAAYDGEVMCISENADVIINDGSVKNGFSADGAGGIHIMENATVVLNNVNVVENGANGSNGAGIAVYDGAILVMNGGSISDNKMLYARSYRFPYGSLYVNDATAMLNNVTISNNRSESEDGEGVAIYADNGTVTLNDCVVSGNGTKEIGEYAESIIGCKDSTININNTDFIGNGSISSKSDPDYSHLFYLEDSKLTMTGGKITGNAADKLFYFEDSRADVNDVTITGNASIVLDVDNDSAKVTLTDCTLGGNEPVKKEFDVIVDTKGTLVLLNCDLGDTTFEDKSTVIGVGSIFGEGSLTMIVALIALVASIASVSVCVALYKKKAVPATANKAEETDDEE